MPVATTLLVGGLGGSVAELVLKKGLGVLITGTVLPGEVAGSVVELDESAFGHGMVWLNSIAWDNSQEGGMAWAVMPLILLN